MLSQFKHDKLWMTVDLFDLMIIDQATSAFLLMAIPSLRADHARADGKDQVARRQPTARP
jgi:hypothetical protein